MDDHGGDEGGKEGGTKQTEEGGLGSGGGGDKGAEDDRESRVEESGRGRGRGDGGEEPSYSVAVAAALVDGGIVAADADVRSSGRGGGGGGRGGYMSSTRSMPSRSLSSNMTKRKLGRDMSFCFATRNPEGSFDLNEHERKLHSLLLDAETGKGKGWVGDSGQSGWRLREFDC